jgi:hypothetical protein
MRLATSGHIPRSCFGTCGLPEPADARSAPPDGYGDAELAISQPAGGLSGAPTDVARLAAILLDDNPALKRVTLEQMLSQGAVLSAAQSAIQGPEGIRGPAPALTGSRGKSPGVYNGQKGGQISDAASVVQFDGEWGFVALGTRAIQPGW